MMSLENFASSGYQENFAKIRLFWWYHLKIRTGPLITMRSVQENKTSLIHSLENLNCPCNHKLKFFQKYPRFNEVIWKFELPLLSRAEIFAKISHFCWTDLMNWPYDYELKFLLMISLKNVTCPYYHELKFSLRKAVLLMSLELLNWPYYHELKYLQK